MLRGEHSLTWGFAEERAIDICDLDPEEWLQLGEMAREANAGTGVNLDDLLYARALSPYKQGLGDAWDTLVDTMLARLELEGHLSRPKQFKLHQRTLKGILANLVAASSQDPKLYVRYSRREGDSDGFSFKPKIRLVNALEKAGFIVYKRGEYDHEKNKGGRQSRMRATEKLGAMLLEVGASPDSVVTQHPPVLMKDEQGTYREPNPSMRARDMARKVMRINETLLAQEVGLDLPAGMPVPHTPNSRLPLDTTRRLVCRIFADQGLKLGGRYYRHWAQEIKREYRPYLTLNGEPTVELDFGCCHPSMLHAEVGLPARADAYELPGVPRDLAKAAFSVLLFHDREETAPHAMFKSAKDKGFDITYGEGKRILAMMRAHHPAIEDYFFKGHSLRLQYKDSCIAEDIMFSLIRDGIPFLPIHDSFVVPKRHESALSHHMNEAYCKHVGQFPIIKRKEAPAPGTTS